LEAGVGGVNGGGCGGLWKFKFRFRFKFSFLGERARGESWNNNPSFSFIAAVKEGSCCAVVLDILRRFKRVHDEYDSSRTAPRRNKYVEGEKLCFVSFSERTGISTALSALEVENGGTGDILERGEGREDGRAGGKGVYVHFLVGRRR
jgi:hypothetical protein